MYPSYDPMGIHFGKGTTTPENANKATSAYYIIPVSSSNNKRVAFFSLGSLLPGAGLGQDPLEGLPGLLGLVSRAAADPLFDPVFETGSKSGPATLWFPQEASRHGGTAEAGI